MATYREVLRYLDKLEMYGIKLGLYNIGKLCELLGNPQDSYKTIHVGGTNGKGSVTAMCTNVLREAGYRTGMYTSPHLQSFRERIQVNGNLITQRETIEMFNKVKKAADGMEKAERKKATYFEFVTAMAFLYFRKKRCDFAVIEVGMGGRLDATNVIKPLVAAITNIELEHQQYLGDTKEKIALEKAGIIKQGIPTVIGEQDGKIRQVLIGVCRERNSEPVIVRNSYSGEVALLGNYQKRNAAMAAEAIKVLQQRGVKITISAMEKGIAEAKWPGRLEVVQENPKVILDGGHNPAGIRTVAEFVKSQPQKIILVIGISQDKDFRQMISVLAPLATKVIVTEAKYRATKAEELFKEVKKHCKDAEVVKGVKAAVSKAIKDAKEEMVVVTGSLFVVGEARGLWHDALA